MGRIEELLESKSILVLDGAMGTELEKRGFDVNDPLWSAKFLKENPDAIKAIHKDYLEAGANIITCCSYQATVPGFLAAGYTKEEAEELIRKSMEIAVAARQEWWEESGEKKEAIYPMLAGDIGPYGAYLADGSEYTGDYQLTKEAYWDFHRRRIEILKEAGAEIFAVETCPNLEEAVAVAQLLEEMDADFWLSFTFKSRQKISDGNEISTLIAHVKQFSHLKAIGVNCTPPEIVSDIITNLKEESSLPICVYPNSGEIYDGIKKIWNGAADGKSFGERAKEWKTAGARLIGGCCRTSPKDISAVARLQA